MVTAVIGLLKPLSLPFHTLTPDDWKGFSYHEMISQPLNAYSLPIPMRRGRGLNGNINGLILQYFPKHRSFTTITEEEI